VSSFEFVLVSIAIVVGFAISEILGGWGRQLRLRHQVRPYLLQIVASAYLLSVALRFLWTLWSLSGAEWTYLGYVLLALPALVLALAAHLVRVDTESLRRNPREQYFESARPFYGLLASFPIFGMMNALYHAEFLEARFGTSTGLVRVVWPTVIAVDLWLAFSRRPRDHWTGLALLWVGNLLITARVLPALDSGP
jgi:hypothetical protein